MAIMLLDRRVVIGGFIALAVAFVIGIAIGHATTGASQKVDPDTLLGNLVAEKFKDEIGMVEDLLHSVKESSIRDYLKELTKEPHLAALERDRELTQWIKSEWEAQGLDYVELAEYEFFLSWPNQSNPNKIYLYDDQGGHKFTYVQSACRVLFHSLFQDNIAFTSTHKEKEVRAGDDHPDFIHAFNAYAPAADVRGDVVYVNYGRVEDLRQLEREFGVSVKGKICMARYGKIYRGNKVDNCQNKGAIGVVLFSDPEDVAVQGTEPENVYPNTIFLPGTGIQRGSTYIGEGDPLSPNWASIENAYRLDKEKAPGLPKIPAQPIGYDDAKVILEKMGGPDSPEEWKGGIKGIQYKLGGEWKPEYHQWSLRIKVNNVEDSVKSSNVIGYIKGDIEPDRYVFLSNHRDAWGYGSVDPSSGTAQLMEVAKILGNLHKTGWNPRRTIVFANWATEEYGLEGSTEWVFHKLNKLSHRSVGLVNTDICVSGPIVKPQASPVLKDIVYDALKMASDPFDKTYFPTKRSSREDSGRSYYNFWDEWWNQDKAGHEKPKVKHLGSGTDHAPFAFYNGIPSVNLRFKDDNKKHKGVGQYPTYHTGYETFYLVDRIIDPGFKIHRVCAQTSLHMLLNLANSLVIPYNLENFPEEMNKAIATMKKNKANEIIEAQGATLDHLEEAIEELRGAAKKFMNHVQKIDMTNPIEVRIINDQLMGLERLFVIPDGLPGRPDTRHAIFAPSKFNKYGASAFPGISDLLHEIDTLSGQELTDRQEQLKRHISDLMIMVKSAAEYLRPAYQI